MVLVAFDEEQIAGRNPLDLIFQRGLRLAAQLVHDDPAYVGHDHDLARARPAVAIRVLTGLIDVEVVVRVLDERHLQASLHEARDEQLDQGGLAASRPSRESEYLHAAIVSGRHSPSDIANATHAFTSRSGRTAVRRLFCTRRSSSVPRAR